MTTRNLVGLVLSALLLAGCVEEATNSTTTIDSNGNPTTGTVSQDSFYVRIYDESKYSYYLQKRGAAFGTGCSIAYGASNAMIDCDARIPELDLNFQDIKIQFNVPKGMCSYLTRKPYFYYNQKAGTHSVSASIDQAAGTCSGGGVYSNGNCAYSTWTAYGNGTALSAYDYSPNQGPNCAEGSYSIMVKPATGDTVSFAGKFIGNMNNCLAGPAVDGINGWPKLTTGRPVAQISDVSSTTGSGLNEVWTIQSTMNLHPGRSNVAIANGFDYQYLFRASGARIHNNVANLYYPEAVVPTLTNAPAANPSYYWYCLDNSYEIKYGIRLWIHEFNTATDFATWGSSSGATGAGTANPDITGNETSSPPASDCSYISGQGWVCNDFSDWDDLGVNYPND